MSPINVGDLPKVSSKNKASFDFTFIDVYLSNVTYIDNDGNESPNVPIAPATCAGYHITHYSPPSPSNLSYPTDKTTYRSIDMWITNPIESHKTTDAAYNIKQDGEIIIKCMPHFASDPVIYVCFFLNKIAKGSTTIINDLDVVIELVSKGKQPGKPDHVTTSLTSVIPKQTAAALCKSINGETFMIFTNPISITSDLSKLTAFTKGDFTINTNGDMNSLGKDNIIIGADNSIYMDCNPTGESNDTIQTYNVPVYSEYTKDASKYATMSFTINFTALVGMVFLIYAFFPKFYLKSIYDAVKAVVPGTSEARATRLTTIEVWYLILIFLFIVSNFIVGFVLMNDGGWSNVFYGIFAIFIYILTNSIIGFTRIASKDETPYNGQFSFLEAGDIMAAVKDFISVLKKSGDRYYWIFWLPVLIITGLVLLVVGSKNDFKKLEVNTFELANSIVMSFFAYIFCLIFYVTLYAKPTV